MRSFSGHRLSRPPAAVVPKYDGPGSSENRARSFARSVGLERVAADAIVLERAVADAPLASFHLHDVKQRSFFVPATRCGVRVVLYSFASDPNEGWAERRQAQLSCCRVCETRLIRAQVRRGASHDAGRSPLGAPPWRFLAG